MDKTLYELIGVGPRASQEEIESVCLKLVRQLQAGNDIAIEAEFKFAELERAYEVLGNPEKRREYDFEIGVADGSSGNSGRKGSWRRLRLLLTRRPRTFAISGIIAVLFGVGILIPQMNSWRNIAGTELVDSTVSPAALSAGKVTKALPKDAEQKPRDFPTTLPQYPKPPQSERLKQLSELQAFTEITLEWFDAYRLAKIAPDNATEPIHNLQRIYRRAEGLPASGCVAELRQGLLLHMQATLDNYFDVMNGKGNSAKNIDASKEGMRKISDPKWCLDQINRMQ